MEESSTRATGKTSIAKETDDEKCDCEVDAQTETDVTACDREEYA